MEIELSQTISDALQATREGGIKEFRELEQMIQAEFSEAEIEGLLESSDPILIRVSIDLLFAATPNEDQIGRLFRLREHDHVDVRQQLVVSLANYNQIEQHTGMLLDLMQDPSGSIRGMAMDILGKFDPFHEEIRRLLREDDSWEVRLGAAKLLRKCDDLQLLPLYLESLSEESDSDVCNEVAKTLNRYFEENKNWPQEVTLPSVSVRNKSLAQLSNSPATKHVKSWLKMSTEAEFDESMLQGFGTVITKEENLKNLPRAWNSEKSITTLTEMLTSDPPQSVVLLGDSGTGKTALVNELAHELAVANPPWTLIQISPSDFLRGTKYLGEWETQLSKFISATSTPKRVILYIPAIHELNTVGKSSSSDNNVASALTPYVERGDIRILGETTERQLQQDFASNPTFKRLLTPMTLVPSDEKLTQEIVFQVLEEAGLSPTTIFVDRLIELSEFSQAGTVNPGRAVGLLRQVLQQHTDKTTMPLDKDILKAIGNATGVSTDLLDDNIALDLKKARAFFENKVIGQPEAVNAAIDLVTLVKSRLNDPDKPFGVMLFVGPTGVGKTELAKSLAEYCFGDVNRLSRLDMSEFVGYDSFERLSGSIGRPGMLTSIVRKQPFSIILLDEIEKAHINVFDLCLQIFDAGRLTDGEGRTADFRRSIIIMTSNVGAKISKTIPLGFNQDSPAKETEGLETQIHRELGHTFRPEFLNRLDRIVLFRPLSKDTAERIARQEVDRVLKRPGITGRKLAVNVDPHVFPLLVEQGYSRAFGARPLKRVIERLLLLPVARKVASGKVPAESVINITARQKQLGIEVTKSTEELPFVELPQSHEVIALKEIKEHLDSITEENSHLAGRKSMLLRRTSNPGFWDNSEESKIVSDEIHQIEVILEQLEWLQNHVRKLTGKEVSKEEITHLNLRANLLEIIAASEETSLQNDAYIFLKAISQRGKPVEGMLTLAKMYKKLAKKFHFRFEVIADQQTQSPDEDSLILKISGIGAAILLEHETGLHELIRRYPPSEATEKDRELIEVDVFPAPENLENIMADDLQIDIQPLKSVTGRLIPQLNWDVRMMHTSTYISICVHTGGDENSVKDRILPLLKAYVLSGENRIGNEKTQILRTYELGHGGVVKDHRTHLRSGKVDYIFQGNLDKFLTIPIRTTADSV